MDGLIVLPAAAALAGLFVWSIHTVGRWLVRGLGLRVVDRQAAHLAAGLICYSIAGLSLGACGWCRWPVLAALAVLPGLVAIGTGIRRLRESLAGLWAEQRPDGAATLALLAIALVYLATAAVPSFHYDLLVNYLGVPKDYLIQGHLDGLDHNIHSSLSLVLHVLIGFVLALSEPLNRTEFLFGTASVWGALHLIVIAATAHRLQVLATVLTRDAGRARRAGVIAMMLWLSMPQTLLLALFENAEFLTTYLALCIAGVALRGEGRDEALTVGALCGVMVAAKPQLAVFGACAVVIAMLRSSAVRASLAAATAALLPALSMLRNWIVFGGPLFPYVGKTADHADAARALLSENAIALPDTPAASADRVWGLLTLQPETGITLLALVLVFLARVRSLRFWLLASVALLVPLLASSQLHNVLRWAQPGLVLLLLAAAVNLVDRVSWTRAVRWAVTGFLLTSLWLALGFLSSTIGSLPHVAQARDHFITQQIPDYAVRQDLMARPGGVLWLGQLYGYYGAAKGPIPAPQNGASIGRILGTGTAESIRQRLLARGVRWICLCQLHHATAPGSAYWSWLDDGRRQILGELLASLPVEHPRNGITIYDLGDERLQPASTDSETP
jgi:hypothetical protein